MLQRLLSPSLLHPQKLDLEQKRRVRRDDATGAPGAVTDGRRDHEGALAADLHRGDAFVPALDDAALPDRELERLPPVERAVELLALRFVLEEPARVVHHARLPGLRRSEEHMSELQSRQY